MSTYKVIQDIEAEDKLLGPLTLRQFIYALIAVGLLYFSFLLYSKGATFLTPLFILPALFCVFFAIPWSREQPTEVWALAKIRFFIKPRRRIWDQSGVKELVTITVPRKIERHLTNGLNQDQVHSRLNALANTLDSRGWAVKNVNLNLYTQPLQQAGDASDRLIDPSTMPQEVPAYDLSAADDMLDDSNNVAQQFQSMITTQAQNHRAQIIQQMAQAAQPTPAPVATPAVAPAPYSLPQSPTAQVDQPQTADYWFMNQAPAAPLDPGQAQFAAPQAVLPGTQVADAQVVASAEEEAIVARAKEQNEELSKNVYGHIHTIQPMAVQQAEAEAAARAAAREAAEAQVAAAAAKPVTPQPDPAIINLAGNNDLDVATIARQAKKAKQAEEDNEVVISLR